MMTKLFAGSFLAVGLLFAGITGLDAGDDAVKDCCALNLACCEPESACCFAEEKLGCCEKGMECCDDVKGCCTAVQKCCAVGLECCDEAKACCGDNAQAAPNAAVGKCGMGGAGTHCNRATDI